ncbi:hypothetical protein IGI04_014403, partial [Brassica rapa subsp. trilocularis]
MGKNKYQSGVAMTRDIEEELSETDEDEPSDETAVEERCEAEGTEKNQNQSEIPCEPASVWSGPVTRSRLRAQEERLQEIAKTVGLGSRQGDQDKPACWFNLITFKPSLAPTHRLRETFIVQRRASSLLEHPLSIHLQVIQSLSHTQAAPSVQFEAMIAEITRRMQNTYNRAQQANETLPGDNAGQERDAVAAGAQRARIGPIRGQRVELRGRGIYGEHYRE